MSAALVFVGPSLHGSTLPFPDDVERRPPARCGDLLRAAINRPRAIALIDGVFETCPSVWHKEILAVMAAGVPVLGAASLGALRAAELAPYGMIGIGTIFAAYRDGCIERDDAVMIAHAPAGLGWAPLSLALVDAEATIAAVPLDETRRRVLRDSARSLNFRDRDWRRVADNAGCPDLAAHLEATTISLKRQDAEALVTYLAADIARHPTAPPPHTYYLAGLLRRIGSEDEARAAKPIEEQGAIDFAA